MANDPLNPLAPLSLNWGAEEQPATPAPVPAGSLDRPALEAMAAGPQVGLVAPVQPGIADTRQSTLTSASDRRAERLDGAFAHRRALLGGSQAALEREALASMNESVSQENLDALPFAQRAKLESDILSKIGGISENQNADRTNLEIASDTGLSIGKGLATGLGSLGTLAGAAIDPELGISAAQVNQDMGQWFDSYRSDTIAERSRLAGVENEIKKDDNKIKWGEDIRSGDSEFIADVKQVGRDFLSTVDTYSEDVGLAGQLITEGVGSLAGSGGVGGLVTKLVGKGVTRVASQKLAEKAIMGGVIGSMEGGDAYGNAALQVMDMDEPTLTEQSPEYRGLRKSGMSHEEAQIELAHDAGIGAASIALPAGAVAGGLVGRFERMPLTMRGAGVLDTAKTTAAQFAEETFQEGNSQFAGNVGLRWSGANPEQELTAGVGEAAALGGIGGAGMAAGLRGAAAVASVPAQVAQGISQARQAVNRRAQANEQQNFEANSPLAKTADEIARTTPVAEAVNTAINTPEDIEPEEDQHAGAKSFLNTITNISPEEQNTLPETLRNKVAGKTKIDALFSLVQDLGKESNTDEDNAHTILFVKNALSQLQSEMNDDNLSRVEAYKPELVDGIFDMVGVIGKTSQMLEANPLLKKGLNQQQVDALSQGSTEVIAELAQQAPTMLDPVKAREALNHSTKGEARLGQNAIRFLALSADLGDLLVEYKNKLDTRFTGSSEGVNRVRNEVFVSGRKATNDPSMVQHIDRIASSVRSGQIDLAREQMETFRLFVEGQNNKLNALRQSKTNANGNAVTYARNTPNGWVEANERGAGESTYLLGKGGPISEALLQNVEADTNAMSRAYARVSEAFPELEAPQGFRPGLKDIQIEAEEEVARQESEAKTDKPYRPRKGTETPSALGSLIEREVSQETAESISLKLDLHMTDDGRVNRSEFGPLELKVFRDVYGAATHHKTIRVPDDLAEQTRAVREQMARIEDERQIELPLEEPVQKPKQEPEPEKAPAKEESVQQPEPEVKLSDLVPTADLRFHEAYQIDQNGSKLLNEKSPIAVVKAQVLSRDRGGVVNEAWNRLLGMGAAVKDGLNTKMKTHPTAVDVINKLIEGHQYKSGNSVLDTAMGRFLALLNKETREFDPRMAEIAGLAFTHWLLNERKPDARTLDDKDVADIFGMDEADVTQEVRDLVTAGNHIENATLSLAETIQKFAGLQPNTKTSRSDAGGIILGLAAEIMDVAVQNNLISISNNSVPIERTVTEKGEQKRIWVKQSYRAVVINNEDVLAFQKGMTSAGELSTLEELIVPEPDKQRFVGEPPKKVAKTQMRNRENTLSNQETRAISNEQNKPSFVNSPFVEFMDAIGRDSWLDMLGYEDVSLDRRMNVQHRKSVEGVNTSLAYGWDGVMGAVAEVDRFAAENQMEQDAVPSYWSYGISKVGRLQQQGFGPQADKQAREALTATVANLDLNDPVQDDQFWMTVAQSIGVKTEKMTRAESVAKAKKFMEQEQVQILLGHIPVILDQSSTGRAKFINEFTAGMKELFNGEVSVKAAHALFAVHHYYETQNREAFKHNLSLESDGKTDGPINAIMNFLSGKFDQTQLMLMSMGGFFVNQANRTLNQHFAESGKDLYEHTAVLFENRLQTMLAQMDGDTKLAMETALRLASITGNIAYSGGQLKVGRGVIKNPLTVSVYGAGETGIAGKVTREIMDTVYTQMTESLIGETGVQDVVNQLSTLINNKVVKGKNGYFVTKATHNSPIGRVDPEKFVLNSEQYAQLRDNIKILLSDPLVQSINEMMGDTKKTMTLMQQSTQIQALIAQERFRNKVAEIKATKKIGEDLSDTEYNQVFKDIAPYGAQIYMPTQSANLGVSEKLGAYQPDPDKKIRHMVSAIGNDQVTGNLKTVQPSLAGVKAAPFMVIMTGDAQMVLRLAANGLEKTLMVFDGIEMAADLMDVQSLEINKQVAEGWKLDNSQAVADSFENFMRQDPLSTPLSETAIKAIDFALTGERDTVLDAETRKLEISKLQERLRNTSDEIRARKATLQEFGYSVDHMASAEQSYTENADKLLVDENGAPINENLLIEKMNTVYEDKLNQIKKERGERQTKEQPNTGLVSLVQSGAAGVRGTKQGAVSLSVSQMFKAVQTAKNSHQRAMLYAALTALRGSGYTFHFGTREELVKLRETLSPGSQQALDLGQTDPVGKHVYIASATTETALHEAIHAATIDKVFTALVEPETSTQAVREAVNRLDLLMEEFMGFDFTQLAGDQSGIDAQATIQGYLNKGTEAGKVYALNEFMAWTLSNQHLIETLQRTKVRNPLARLAMKVLRTLKGLLGLQSIPDNMYANTRFNTQVILDDGQSDTLSAPDVLDHTVDADAHTANVMNRFNTLFKAHITSAASKANTEVLKNTQAINRAKTMIKVNRVLASVMAAGFDLGDQQQQAFKSILQVMMTEMDLNSPSRMRAQKMFRHAMDNLKPESFMINPQSTNPNDISRGQDMFNVLTGAIGLEKDLVERTTLLGTFMALSQIHPQFRDILRAMPSPKSDDAVVATSRFDEIVTKGFNSMAESMASMMYDGKSRGYSVGQTMDNLAMNLSEVQKESQFVIERLYNNAMLKAEDKIVQGIQSGVDKSIETLKSMRLKQNNLYLRALTGSAAAFLSMGSNKYSKEYAEDLTHLFNSPKAPIVLRDLWSEFRGDDVLQDMMNKVKSVISASRQKYLDVTPHVLMNQFKKKLTSQQWASLSASIASTDMGNLITRYSLRTIQQLAASPKALQAEINRVKSELQALDGARALQYESKAEALALYMVTGEMTSRNLLTNSQAIARLLNDRNQMMALPEDNRVDLIDDLTSLLAMQKTSSTDMKLFTDLAKEEEHAIGFMLATIQDLDRKERKKSGNMRAIFNHVKGQMDSIRSGSEQVIIAEETDFKRLSRLGYIRLDEYKGDEFDRGGLAYFYSPVQGKSTYHQGVMQTVQQTMYGVDVSTGYTVGSNGEHRIGRERARTIANKIRNKKKDNLPVGEYLKPVFNDRGEVTAYERVLSAQMQNKTRKDNHLASRIAAWQGRQEEEKLAQEYNRKLVEILGNHWSTAEPEDKDQFVDIGRAENRDRVLNHVWGVIPKEMKNQMIEVFGAQPDDNNYFPEPQFWVRRDMLNNALGYPGASIGDFFTGNNRISPEANAAIQKFMTAVMGNKAYQWLVQSERTWQSAVSTAKSTVVIRSVIVPFANIISNVMQMLARRVPLRYFTKPLAHKVMETNAYLRNKVRQAELEAEGIAAKSRGDMDRVASLRAKYRTLEDENRSLSIWPLIERGEFSTISDGLTEADKAVDNQKLMDMIEAQVNRLPEGVKTIGKYAIVSRDTALFKLLNRSVQYGDFLAKALVYDHKLSQGLSPDEAYKGIRSEFVNYNLLPGRTRTLLEGLGFLWFWNYKIRITKVALDIMRNNPLTALLWSMSAVQSLPIEGINSGPVMDNVISKGIEGKLPGTMGPGMFTMLFESNPWVRLAN